jgi:hypothetical protein
MRATASSERPSCDEEHRCPLLPEMTPVSAPPQPRPARPRSLVRLLFINCLTLLVIFTLCLYGLGVVGLYLRWFVLESPPPPAPPVVVTVVLPSDPGTEQIIITVVVTQPPPQGTPTATLEPTPTQSWPWSGPVPENGQPVTVSPGPQPQPASTPALPQSGPSVSP